ncbi:MAG: hypothetical protein WKF89_15980 [Chitinophagaceae bacterium]
MRNQMRNRALLLVSLSLVLLSCRKEISLWQFHSKNVRKISVSNIGQLYRAVNDSANAGYLIVLAPGTYLLDSTFPNGGRIEFQQDMTLEGQTNHPEEVIIDASSLPGTSFNPPLNFPAARTGAIRMGRGVNSIEWLTVKGNSNAQALSVIDTDLIWAGISRVKIAHSIVTGGRIGIDIRNVGPSSMRRTIEAEITDNNVLENLVQFGQGIEVQNANGATGAVIRANLSGNYVHRNKVGLRAFNNNANNTRSDSGSINIQSRNDRFEENGVGLHLIAGLNQGSTTTSNGNLLHFDARGTSIQNNLGTLPPDITDPSPGGINASGGYSINAGLSSNNRLEISLWDCMTSGNRGPDINVFGAFSTGALPAGTNNLVEIQLKGISSAATVVSTPSLPAEPVGTNVVKIFR